MSHPLLEKYHDLRPLNDEKAVNALLGIMVALPPARWPDLFAQSRAGGRFYMFRHDSQPNRVVEYVPDNAQDTSVSTLYAEHPMFESRQKLLDAREEIIGAIDHLLMAIPNTATVRDDGREREFTLPELGTAQLLDVLKHFSTH